MKMASVNTKQGNATIQLETFTVNSDNVLGKGGLWCCLYRYGCQEKQSSSKTH